MRTFWYLSLGAFCFVALNSVRADDLNPPPWQRGGPLTTSAEWDFQQNTTTTLPDGNSVPTVIGDGLGPSGVPSANAGPGLTWIPFDGTGGWLGPGDMVFDIPNWIDNEPFKYLWIQITYQENPTAPFPGVISILPSDPLPTTVTLLNVFDYAFPGTTIPGLRYHAESWQIQPNPDFERIIVNLQPDSVLSQVVIDTISIPEPSTLILAFTAVALCCVSTWRRRRRA